MDYVSKLTDEELRVIFDLIPLRHFRESFKMSPKRFNRLSKYRPEKMPLLEIKRIVVNRGSDPFISDRLNSSIQSFLYTIQIPRARDHKGPGMEFFSIGYTYRAKLKNVCAFLLSADVSSKYTFSLSCTLGLV